MDERQRALVRELKWGNSWLLFLLFFVTLGIYPIYYFWRQTNVMNRHMDEDDRMSVLLTAAITVFIMLTVLLALPAALPEDPGDWESMHNLAAQVAAILIALWGLKARRRMNWLLDAEPGDPERFSWIASLFFTPIYFNIKVNHLAGSLTPEDEGGEGERTPP